MRTKVLLISCLLVFVLGCNLLPNVNALIFDIGTKINENDLEMYTFSSGVVVMTDADYINYVPSIFDGNTSTGINHNFGSGHQSMRIELFFPYSFNISNITVKPNFGGGTTKISSFSVAYKHYTNEVYFNINKNTTFQINCTLDGIGIFLENGGTNQFYFNDVIINYTINLTDLNAVNQALNIIQNSINSLQNQINNFNAEIIELRNLVEVLNNTVHSINNTINNLNQTQKQILENITHLWTIYDSLNGSFNNLKTEIDNLNLTLYQNITNLEKALIIIEQDIGNIQNNIDNITFDVNKIPPIQDQINKTIEDLNNLNNNLTALEASIPSEYNDTALSTRVFQLESENANYKLKIGNLTSEIDALNMEIRDLNTELDALKSDLDNIKDHDDDEDEDEDGAEDIGTLAYGGIGLGILGIVIALTAIGMLMKKRSPPQIPLEAKEEPIPQVSPEQPQITETEVQTPEAQPQTPSQTLPQEQLLPLDK